MCNNTNYIKSDVFDSKENWGIDESIGKDVFVHQSHITPKQSTYRSLEENEYVEFALSLDDRNTTQAVNVTGIMNGSLLCDAHAEKQKYNQEKENSSNN